MALVIMVDVFMALLSFSGTPRAYRLKASKAAPLISTSAGTWETARQHFLISPPRNYGVGSDYFIVPHPIMSCANVGKLLAARQCVLEFAADKFFAPSSN